MKSMKKVISIFGISVVIIGILALAGYSKGENKVNKQSVIGEWRSNSATEHNYKYTFNINGTGIYEYYGTQVPFEYEDKGDKLIITFEGNAVASEFEYRIEEKNLIIKDNSGNDVIYSKQ